MIHDDVAIECRASSWFGRMLGSEKQPSIAFWFFDFSNPHGMVGDPPLFPNDTSNLEFCPLLVLVSNHMSSEFDQIFQPRLRCYRYGPVISSAWLIEFSCSYKRFQYRSYQFSFGLICQQQQSWTALDTKQYLTMMNFAAESLKFDVHQFCMSFICLLTLFQHCA